MPTTPQDIKRDWKDNWLAQDGLTRLTLEDDRAPFSGGQQRTVCNENGILFTAYTLALLSLSDCLQDPDSTAAYQTVRQLEALPGLYHRHPGQADRTEAHDDYVGVQMIAGLFAHPFSLEIYEYGLRYGFSYDNIHPGSWTFSQTRQGGEVGFYKVMAEAVPSIYEWAWLCIGLLISGMRGTPGQVMLSWLRCFALSIKSRDDQHQPSWVWASFGLTSVLFHGLMRKRFGGSLPPFDQYFISSHPIVRLKRHLEEKGKQL